MKILFIDPPFHRFMGFYRYYYPLGLAYMAAVLRERGHEATIYDAEHAARARTQSWSEAASNYGAYLHALADDGHEIWAELPAILERTRPDLIGITMLSVKAPSAQKVAAMCKSLAPAVPVVVGADHPTALPEQTLADPHIDFVVRGEGEATIAELVECLEQRGSLAQVAGLSWKDDGRIVHNPDRAPIADLDTLPLPAIDALIGAEHYRPVDFGAIMASRGCPYRCTFCGVATLWPRKVRYRSPESVVAEIRWLHERYGTEYFSFRDASFTLHKRRIQGLCEALVAGGPRVQWECITRADLLDDALLALMRRAGCVTIRLGIESGSPELLRYMKKEIDLERVKAAARLLNRHGFYWSAYFLFGTPGETPETIAQSLALIEEIDPPFVTIARFAPIPGTEMYEELVQAGRISPGIDWASEGNQHRHTDYTLKMSGEDLDRIMDEVVLSIEARNARKSAELGMRDGRA